MAGEVAPDPAARRLGARAERRSGGASAAAPCWAVARCKNLPLAAPGFAARPPQRKSEQAGALARERRAATSELHPCAEPAPGASAPWKDGPKAQPECYPPAPPDRGAGGRLLFRAKTARESSSSARHRGSPWREVWRAWHRAARPCLGETKPQGANAGRPPAYLKATFRAERRRPGRSAPRKNGPKAEPNSKGAAAHGHERSWPLRPPHGDAPRRHGKREERKGRKVFLRCPTDGRSAAGPAADAR